MDRGAGAKRRTEAALWRFKIRFEAGKVDALAFLLPTRFAAVSREGRVRRFFRQPLPDPALRPNVVLAVPGYIQSDGERGSRHADGAGLLSRFETLWPDTAVDSAAHRRRAAEHPKRALAAAAAVGTIDRALLSGRPVRHAHLRGAALPRALIVVDEVHASDACMTGLLTGVLRRHVDAGGHALLLSAALGSEARDRLVIQPTRRLPPNRKRRPDGAEDPSQSPCPALSDAKHIRAVAGTSTELRFHWGGGRFAFTGAAGASSTIGMVSTSQKTPWADRHRLSGKGKGSGNELPEQNHHRAGQARWKALYRWHAGSPSTTCWSISLRGCPSRKPSMISPI